MSTRPVRRFFPSTLVVVLTCLLTSGWVSQLQALRIVIDVPAPMSPSEKILRGCGLKLAEEELRKFLQSNGKEMGKADDAPDVAALIAQLGAASFQDREAATRELLTMDPLPMDAISEALRTDDPEVRVRLQRIKKEARDRSLHTPVVLFAILTFVEEKKLKNLLPDVMQGFPNYVGQSTKLAAKRAMMATVDEKHRTFLTGLASAKKDAELKEEKGVNGDEVQALAKKLLLLLDGRLEAADRGEVVVVVGKAKAIWQDFLDELVIRGERPQGESEFLPIDPATGGKGFQIVRKEANTLGSVAQRHKNAPWLYPTAGENERPHVLVENGARLYPIRGSWEQNWNGKWMPLDERGAAMKAGDQPTGVGHRASAVSFLVVPAK